MLTDMGFGVSPTAAAIDAGVSTLSGGWRMKLAFLVQCFKSRYVAIR